jgi:hypothetical protein
MDAASFSTARKSAFGPRVVVDRVGWIHSHCRKVVEALGIAPY